MKLILLLAGLANSQSAAEWESTANESVLAPFIQGPCECGWAQQPLVFGDTCLWIDACATCSQSCCPDCTVTTNVTSTVTTMVSTTTVVTTMPATTAATTVATTASTASPATTASTTTTVVTTSATARVLNSLQYAVVY
mgnify:CR=1 FL=1